MGVELEQEQVEAGKAKIREMFSDDAKIGAEIPPNSENNSTDLSEAAFTGNLAAMKQALSDGADPNTKDPTSGSTLLATAALMGHTEIVGLLLEHDADINARSQDGGTALHAAAFLGRAETVKLLLEKGGFHASKQHGWHSHRWRETELGDNQRDTCHVET